MILVNLLDFCNPPIYRIFCEATERSYFGHSENVLYRLGRHYNDLQTHKNHETRLLQADWDKYGREAFRFEVLECGPEWENKQKRVKREKFYLLQSSVPLNKKERLYNMFPVQPSTFSKRCVIDGIEYPSGAEAARQLGISPSAIYRLLKKMEESEASSPSNEEGYGKIIQRKQSTARVSIEGREFKSIKDGINTLSIPK
uniref:Putative GIY-YIG homing endonuclease n=1 Tax=Pleurastrosarcina brevispinosa TaxID=163096 RepID=A0A097KNA7_9CHLO|nr:putative GIY-YIG homing endonuclease [Chlorosarcina brevispinosa]